MFLPNDSMFKAMDSMCLRFVLMAEGVELNKVNIHKSYNVLHVTSPHRLGGMGLHQLFWAHRARFITMVQNTLRSRPGSIGRDPNKEVPSRAVSICNYLARLTQLGVRTALHVASTEKAPMTAPSRRPAENRWWMPSTRATTLPHTGATKTPLRAQCLWDTTPVTIAYRAAEISNRQPERPYTTWHQSCRQSCCG